MYEGLGRNYRRNHGADVEHEIGFVSRHRRNRMKDEFS